jgi:hypothetical protein
MRQLIITLGAIFLLVNLAFGLALKSFETFNLVFSSGVIVATTIIFFLVDSIKMKDAFKVSLFLINGVCGLIEYVIALIAERDIPNNWYYVVLIVILAFQLILITTTNITSKKIS